MSRGAGSVFELAGKRYVWTRNEAGRFEAVPFTKVLADGAAMLETLRSRIADAARDGAAKGVKAGQHD